MKTVYDVKHALDHDLYVDMVRAIQSERREYCYLVYRNLPDGKSGADSIRKAIDIGLIVYDENMV